MSEKVQHLDVNIAALLRQRLKGVDNETAWQIARLCEQAQAIGYEQGYIRGMTDGMDRADRQREERDDSGEAGQ